MREGNKLVDYIANLAIDIRDYSFVHINNMNSTGRSIFNSDKLKTPYLRITPIRGQGAGEAKATTIFTAAQRS